MPHIQTITINKLLTYICMFIRYNEETIFSILGKNKTPPSKKKMVLITVIVRSKTTIYLQDDHKVYLSEQMSVAQHVDHL